MKSIHFLSPPSPQPFLRLGGIGGGRRRERGFALVVTLMFAALLTIVALGLLSISTISLRGGTADDARSTARANARLSLMMAIGELQRQTGSDTRVTARADILAASNPPVLGVWSSWQGNDHETTGTFAGRPISPGDYTAAKKARFLGYLTSSNTTTPTTLPTTTAVANSVTLLGPGTVGTGAGRDSLEIHLAPQKVTSGTKEGSMAWWIGGENQKARLPKPYQPASPTAVAGWATLTKSHSIADTKPLRLEPMLTDATLADKTVSIHQTDLVATGGTLKASREFFHDVSTVSTGLLTNTANGGWRKDMSLLTENWAAQPTSGMPMFRVTPDKDILTNRATASSPQAQGSMVYPWASYRGTAANIPIYQEGAVTSWENLSDYATFYKRANVSGNRFTTTCVYSNIWDPAFTFSYIHRVRILPSIARIQWVFSHWAAPAAGDPTKMEPRLLLTPVITLWNPHNVEINCGKLAFVLRGAMPAALRYTVGGSANTLYNAVMGNSEGNGDNNQPALGAGQLSYSIDSTINLKPGETRLFSPTSAVPVASTQSIPLQQGYRSGGGHYFSVLDNGGAKLTNLPSSTSIKADAKFDSTHYQVGYYGVGIYLDVTVDPASNPLATHLAYRMTFTTDVANAVYKPMTQLAEATLGDCAGTPRPFMATMFGARMASNTNLPSKGFVQSSPFVTYTALGKKDEIEAQIARHYGGTAHPVNSPFDYSFVKLAPAGDSYTPNASDTTGSGYIVTGFNKSDGLSRCVISELPLRPLTSVGELVNWDLRYDNPIPPYSCNLIGNSDASPLLPSNAVVNTGDAGLAVNLQYDDSYCANHLLFDDWFFSSITPDPTAFGTTGRTQRTTYTDFVSGKTPLPNRSYLPIPEDKAAASANTVAAVKLYTDQVSKVDSWKTIASRLEVEGMFNVNSTSVTAWRCLLGHARKQQVPYTSVAGGSWDNKLSSAVDYAVSRFSIAGDGKTGEASTSGAWPDANQFAGYRTLDEKFLDSLAVEIVNQIRQRGPFLSLSEFINRQLSTGNLALAGTLQSALDTLTKTGGSNDFLAAVKGRSNPSVASPPIAAQAEYKYPDAAVGYNSYGLPGWTRQADILRPLAPILSARDDTFTIRAYGDARDPQGKVLSSAVCEAVVRRTREFVDLADAANITTSPTSDANKKFGRRYQIISFRWLAPGEI